MEGAPHTAKTNLGVPLGCPLPMYIKEGGREAGPLGVCQEYGVLLGLPGPSRNPFPFWSRRDGKRKRERE